MRLTFQKEAGMMELLFMMNMPNTFLLPNYHNNAMVDRLSNSVDEPFLILSDQFLASNIGSTLLIKAYNINSENITIKAKSDVYSINTSCVLFSKAF